ncbi:Y-family DNA polymerase [Paraferrimonas haliotis]|uniref:Y-family DNA polymerase n=1 Tax=Paraferrimonas haliotis TaxID=2013866 RepID=UPI000BA917C3|nr:DNA polymerase Y family protein [Paraferrimonas haliotis]
MWWLAVHDPCLSLNYLMASNQKQGVNPAAVLLEGKPARVIECNAAATQAGVSIGQSMATATALESDLQLFANQAELACESLNWLARWSYRFSARVALRAPACVLLEIGSMVKLFGGVDKLLEDYRYCATLHGLTPSLAIADNPLAAELLARSGQAQLQLSRPKVKQALQRLSVAELGLLEEQVKALQGMGLRQFADLQTLPLVELGHRFGPELSEQLARLSGTLPQPLAFYQPPPGYQRRLPLNHEIEQLSALQFPLQRLLGELQVYLQQRQLAVSCWKLWLKYRDKQQQWLTFELAFAQCQANKLLELAQLQLTRHQLSAPVIEMGIKVTRFGAYENKADSWLPQTQGREQKQQLVARLQARMGQERVSGLGWQDQHRPEKAWCRLPVNQPQSAQVQTAKSIRPSWLLEEPQAINRQQLMLVRGPERIESGWWDSDWVQRDYYLARHEQGALCWVFRTSASQDGLQNQWFIHGWFG